MKWDLTYFYKNHNDFYTDLDTVQSIIKELSTYQGKLHDVEKLKEYLHLQNKLEKIFYKAYQYASLKSDLNKKDVSAATDFGKVRMIISQLNTATAFESAEILALGEEKVKDFIKNNAEFSYLSFPMEKLFHSAKHYLSGDKELLLSYFSMLEQSGSSLYSSLAVADAKSKTITLSNKEKVTVTQGNWRSLIQEAKSANDRKKIFNTLYSGYETNKNTYAQIYNTVMQAEKASYLARNYDSILQSHLFYNNIPTEVFTNLIDVASKNSAPLKKYYELRKQYLGLKTHYSYDRFLELASSSKKYSYDEAKELFFNSLKNCPEDFQNKAHEVLKDGFVDVYEQDGKRSGAYSSSMPDMHPFILLNYSGTLDDVFTVAHEAGHSIHSMYSAQTQPSQLQDYTIFVAEIASTFNEHMLLDYLLSLPSLSNDEKIMLLQKQIDEICSTFYRQTLFANYEYEVSKLVEKDTPINHEVLSNIMIKLYKKYYGLNIKKEKVKQFVWAYIPHLFYTPFYVYQYATSFAASFVLYKNVKERKNGAFDKYINLLKAGGSQYPMDEVKAAGVDFTKKDSFMAVIERMNELVSSLEELINNAKHN